MYVLIMRRDMRRKFPYHRVRIPDTLIIGTEEFDAALQELNNNQVVNNNLVRNKKQLKELNQHPLQNKKTAKILEVPQTR